MLGCQADVKDIHNCTWCYCWAWLGSQCCTWRRSWAACFRWSCWCCCWGRTWWAISGCCSRSSGRCCSRKSGCCCSWSGCCRGSRGWCARNSEAYKGSPQDAPLFHLQAKTMRFPRIIMYLGTWMRKLISSLWRSCRHSMPPRSWSSALFSSFAALLIPRQFPNCVSVDSMLYSGLADEGNARFTVNG